MPFPYRGENKKLNDDTRKAAPGSFIKLTDGFTHYGLGGPETGFRIVLVHGFSVPYFIFDPTFIALTGAGFRVLRYDLFGRGWSDRPAVQYNLELFVRQLEQLMDGVEFEQAAILGLSMGGPISASFAGRYPDRVNKLILIGPVGAGPIKASWLFEVVRLPILGELVFGLFGSDSMLKSLASDFYDPALVREFLPGYKSQMQYRGFKQAILSSVRNGMLGSFLGTYQQVGRLNIPTLLLWGRNDTTVPFSQHQVLQRVMPGVIFHAIHGSNHIPHYEKPETVNPILLQFLK